MDSNQQEYQYSSEQTQAEELGHNLSANQHDQQHCHTVTDGAALATIEDVLSALFLAIQEDQTQRNQGEQHLKELETSNSYFGKFLCTIMCEQGTEPTLRQMAATVLKKTIEYHWDVLSEKFYAPVIEDQVKDFVRSHIISSLVDPMQAIRNQAAQCAIIIANYDWPDRWPTLFDSSRALQLTSLLEAKDGNGVDGAMRVITEFVNCIDDQQIPKIVPILLSQLHSIVVNTSWSLQMRALGITNITKLLATAYEFSSDNNAGMFKSVIAPALPEWCQLVTSMLSCKGTAENLPLQIACINAAIVIVRHFSTIKKLRSLLRALLSEVWTRFREQLPAYVETCVNGDGAETHVDENGNILTMETFIISIMEFFEEIMMSQDLKKRLKPSLSSLISLAIKYMQITEEESSSWIDDADRFLQDEENECYSQSVRSFAARLVDDVFGEYGTITSSTALLSAAAENFEESLFALSSSDFNWWKQCEAVLFAVSSKETHSIVIDAVRNEKLQYDLRGFMDHILSESSQHLDCPFLIGRALIVTGRFSEVCSPMVVTGMLELAISGIEQAHPIPIQIGAVKGVNDFSRVLFKSNIELVLPYVHRLLFTLLGLAKTSSTEVLREVVETLSHVVKLDLQVTASLSETLIPTATAIFLKAHADPEVADAIGDLFSTLTEVPELCSTITERVVPTFVGVIMHHQQKEYTGVAEIALEVLIDVVKHCPEPYVQTLLDKSFFQIIQALMHTDDIELMQSSIKPRQHDYFVHYPILARFENNGASSLYLIVQLIAKLFSDDVPEVACTSLGTLITTLILKAGDDLGSYVNEILLAVLHKLQKSSTLTVLMSLVFIFARLVNENTTVALDFLEQHAALAFVLNLWCSQHSSFYGDYEIKVSTSALIKILMSGHPSLDTICLEGDPVEEKGIRTRSKSRKDGGPKYTQIPAKIKIFKVLLNEYQEQFSKPLFKTTTLNYCINTTALRLFVFGNVKQSKLKTFDSDDEDEEWEDVDDDDCDDEDCALPTFAPADDFYHASDAIDLGMDIAGLLSEYAHEEEENDPDIIADPISQIDLLLQLKELFSHVVANVSTEDELFKLLTETERDILKMAVDGL
eukprot:gene11310-3347_t